MHYVKRLRNAHRILANRCNLVANFLDDWPLGKAEDEAETDDPGMDELATVAGETENEIIDLQQRVDFTPEEELRDDIPAIIDSLRERVGRLNMVAEVLDETDEETLMDALLCMYHEKLRIERYCQWHRREKGVDPLRAAQPLPSRFGIPETKKTYFDPPN